MSNMKNGFSTLNRWLGKKNKTDKATPNGKLSKSSTNLSSLSVSSTNINETSQLEYNRITPLPVATSNAPFEQTFRITVLLPKDQLYVARLGARVPLSKLLELVCENKLLDATKYEFRSPVDLGQVYSCDLTIGAVGLSEIRLCHKSESYDNFNADEIIKLHRTAIIRDSLSSSEFSSRYSKHTTKTTSPYSSSNSLNSMDSTGMNCVRTPVTPPATLTTTAAPNKIAAPPRKKRAAPRPPSQTAIPEKTVLVTNGSAHTNNENMECSDDSLPRKDRFASTPNLSVQPGTNDIDSNGNIGSPNIEEEIESSLNGYAKQDVELEETQVQQKNARNLCGGSIQNLSSSAGLSQSIEFPEPSPRKRMIQMKKKVAAPAPPSRSSMYADSDTISIKSMTPSTPDTPLTPLTPNTPSADMISDSELELKSSLHNSNKQTSPTPSAPDSKANTSPLQSSTPVLGTSSLEPSNSPLEAVAEVPKPLPRVTTNTLLNGSSTSIEASSPPLPTTNVSKIMLNRTPTPEPRSLSTEPPCSDSRSYLGAHIAALESTSVLDQDDNASSKQADCVSFLGTHIAALKSTSALERDDDALSKQADSGIGEPVPSPIPDSLPSEGSAHEGKSAFESSSDDDDIVKVYNFKLGKTVVKSPTEPHTLEDFVVLAAETQTDSEGNTPALATQEATPNFSDSASWNFAIPISPPPNFADGRFADGIESEKPSDAPITPKIKERPVMDFESISGIKVAHNTNNEVAKPLDEKITIDKTGPLPSPTTPLNEIVDELSAIINEKRLDTIIKKVEDEPKIEAAKPNTLSNFSITTITQQTQEKQPQTASSTQRKIDPTSDELIIGVATANNESNLNSIDSASKQRQAQLTTEITNTILPPNSISSESPLPQSSLAKIEQNGFSPSRRRSSGELSIGESPSLQSPEVIKTILNSRKNSSASNSDGESKAASAETAKPIENKSGENANIAPIAETPKNINDEENAAEAINDSTQRTKPKELPKVYRYSGPPSINFSTWNERPKVQVSIKNEGDYIFGGKNADSQSAAVTTAALEINTISQARSNRLSMPASAFWAERENAPPSVAPKPVAIAPTERMGIPEKEYRVPMTVKPLQDVTAENVELYMTTTNSARHQVPTKIGHRKSTSITTVLLNGDSETEANKSESITKRSFATTVHTSTLPRSNTNRFSTPVANIVGPSLLRSTSISQLEASKLKHNHTEAAPPPFGQNTLRKTGLKEKILAKEAEAQKNAKDDSSTPSPMPPRAQESKTEDTTTISNGFVSVTKPKAPWEKISVNQKAGKPIQSAKLELKLQKSTSVYVNQRNPSPTTNTTTTLNTQSAPKSAPIAPPLPPAPTKVVPLRTPNGSAATTPSSPDPRDQLLVAIRNFKREELNPV
ncbi:PREDICTED: mucin-5AC [Rhagoletis zephyria]|uniref:mucin-5AC n=1 Tax=Rhagoletis zephyria TaxID=28612 RepID=UPI0008113B4C|nr:PREDICTED: mucin-5AC [Rhagoletis zephyria]XP_017475458.1 PREDICTED: mucin-5AC [Rhagoletis zephyria]